MAGTNSQNVTRPNIHRWAETEHDIPVTQYFQWMRTPLVALFHGATTVFTLGVALFSFLRAPFWATCSTQSVCGCLHREQFRVWFNESCAKLGNASATSNATAPPPRTPGIFDTVDAFAVLIAALPGVSNPRFSLFVELTS